MVPAPSATRSDLAATAAAVLTGEGHETKTYELGGGTSFTLAELAAAVTAATGTPITYHHLPEAEGKLHIDTGDLSRLIGRPTITLTEAVAAAIA